MKYRIFSVSAITGGEEEMELNAFLAAHRIFKVERAFVHDGGSSRWTFCVEYDARSSQPTEKSPRGKVDYREVLNDQDFSVYSRLRDLRKKIAEKEGVQLYAAFTNEQMAEMVQRRVASKAQLREIPGVGEAKVDKYADARSWSPL